MMSWRYKDMAAGKRHNVQEGENMLSGEYDMGQWA
jgi:hypothetical protein